MTSPESDGWNAGKTYEDFMGRWSRPLALKFLEWIAPTPGGHWMDVGTGTGALAAAICRIARPASVVACDPSAAFIESARGELADPRVTFVVAGAASLDEGRRFPICNPEALESLFEEAGVERVRVAPVSVPTEFGSFEDYWRPFLGGTGPAPGFVATLSEDQRRSLVDELRRRLSAQDGGPIRLQARAWAVVGHAGTG
jgi:SAM-dependent methyltransferase